MPTDPPYPPYLGFDASYDGDRDVRVGSGFTNLLRELGCAPEGKVHYVAGARRAGKTWAAQRLAAQLGERARYVDLRTASLHDVADAASEVAIIDEPGEAVRSNPAGFIDSLRVREGHAVVFSTPAELAAIASTGNLDRTTRPVPLPDLCVQDVAAMTGRCERSADLDRIVHAVQQVDPRWLATPLRLECLCAAALDWLGSPDGGSGTGGVDAEEMIARARVSYVKRGATLEYLVGQGLNPEQRHRIRSWWWPREAGLDERHDTAAGRAATTTAPDFTELALAQVWTASAGFRDPLLDEWLSVDLRMHHVSDLHLGGVEATTAHVEASNPTVDASNPTVAAVAGALGVSPLADAYARHIQQLAESPSGHRPDRVIVTGDLLHNASEAATRSDLVTRARGWLEQVEKEISPHPGSTSPQTDPGVILLPGNHDIDRRGASAGGCRTGTADNDDRRHGWFTEQFGQWCREPVGELPLPGEVGLRVLWSTAPAQTPVVPQADPADTQHWSDPSAVAGDAIADLARGSSAEVCIVALHHAVAPMPDTEVGEWSQLVNAGAVQEACLNGRVALVLHGHAHRGWLGAFSRPRSVKDLPDERWTTRVACAATLGSAWAANEHGFNEVIVASERRAWSSESAPLRTVGVRPWTWTGSHWTAGDWCLFHPGAADELAWDDLYADR